MSQVNAFGIIYSLEIIIAKLAACNVSVIWLVSIAEQTVMDLVGNPEDRFSRDEAHIIAMNFKTQQKILHLT